MRNRSLVSTIVLMSTLLSCLATTLNVSAQSTETEATRLLKQRSAEFEQEVIRVDLVD